MINKPHIICHMMSTLDGKIASGVKDVDILGDYFDLYTKYEDKLNGTAWMCGRVTMEMFTKKDDFALPEVNGEIEKEKIIAESGKKYMIGIDTKGCLRWKSNKIKLSNVEEELELIIVVTNKTPQKYLAYLKSMNISYVNGGESEIEFQLLFEKLFQLGIGRLLLEGGGNLNGSVLKQDLIDEVSLILTPTILNSKDAPSLFDNVELKNQTKKFHLNNIEKVEKDCIWIRYIK